MHMPLNNAVCLNTVSYKYYILMYIRIFAYVWNSMNVFVFVCVHSSLLKVYVIMMICMLVAFLNFVPCCVVCLPGCSAPFRPPSAPLATHAYLFDVNESFRRANKAKSMEISKTNCNLLFIARCMARTGAGGTERVPEEERRRKGKRDPIVAGPHRLPSVGVHTYILYSIYYRIYTIYSRILYAVCAELRCPWYWLAHYGPVCRLLVDCRLRFGLVRFGLVFISIRFQFSKCQKAGLLHLVSWLCNQCSFYHKLIIF